MGREKWATREEDKWKMEGEWMRGDTHSDMEKWKTCWERHLVISKQGDSWLGPNTPLPSLSLSRRRRFTCHWASKPPHYHLFYHSIFPQKQGRRTSKEREVESGWREKRKTPQIYMPLRNWDCISLSCAIVYCAWLSNGKKWNREGMSWLLSHQSCCLCGGLPALAAVCSHRLGNPNTPAHFAQAQRDSSSYTWNSDEAPNQTQKGHFTLGHIDTHRY